MSSHDTKNDWHEIARRSRMMLQDCDHAMAGVWVSLRESNLQMTFDVMEQLMEMHRVMEQTQDFLETTPNPKYEE